ncbi:hypothetical protein QQ045_021261 [Rhodiola kirilowii]
MKKWREEDLVKTRDVWLSITGLPFKSWREDNYKLAAASHGIFIKEDERDVQHRGLGKVRMLVETHKMDRISEVAEAKIQGRIYEIKIIEECFMNGCETENVLKDMSFKSLEEDQSSGQSPKELEELRVGGASIGEDKAAAEAGENLGSFGSQLEGGTAQTAVGGV